MSDDRTILFEALVVHRGHLSREQLDRVAGNAKPGRPLDEELVQHGFLSAADRQDLWAEIDRLEIQFGGDVPRILKAIQESPGQSTMGEKHTGTTHDTAKANWMSTSEESDEVLGATVIAHREETVDTPKIEKKPTSPASPPTDSPQADDSTDQRSASTSDLLDPDLESNPFEETLVSKNPDGGMLQTVDRGAGPKFDPTGETVDYEPETQSRYTLTRVHGEGGLGQVWLATDPTLNREIALKRIRPGKGNSRDAQLRLIKEAQITGQLEHPNIIPIYELEQYDEKGRPYYTMKFLRGDTLQDRIKAYHKKKKAGEANPLELVTLLNFFIDICNAIAYAASRGVVHRDLKPQNVMIGDFGEVIVLDWGLAKKIEAREDDSSRRELQLGALVDSTATVSGQVVGSPAYMAPEQASALNDQVDGRTDVYGLGAMLFSILAGQPPHRGTKTGNTARDTIELLNRISTGETPHLREVDPSIPKALDAICAKAMHKGARHRYQDARDLAQDVQRFLADEAVTVLKESGLQKIGRWLRRHRAWAQSIALAVLLISVVSVVSAVVVNSAKNRETAARQEAVAHFQQARRSIDKSLIELSDMLDEYPGVQTVRTRLLEDAAKEYEALAARKSSQPELQLESSRALVRLARVRQLLEDFEGAVSGFQQALAGLEPIAQADPENMELRIELATCLNGLGVCWADLAPLPQPGDESAARDRVETAEEYYGRAAKLVKEALQVDEKNVELQRMLARITANLGVLLSRTDRVKLAQEHSTRAEELFQALAVNPGDTEDIASLAKSQTALARLLTQQGDSESAVAKLKDALKTYQQLVNRDDSSTKFLRGLADTRLTLANAMHADGDFTSQLTLYMESAEDYLALVRTRPDVPVYRSNLVTAETNIAQIQYRLGESDVAIEHVKTALEQVIALVDQDGTAARPHEQEVYVRVTFGQVLRDLGEFVHAETAFKTADEICGELVKADPEYGFYCRLHGEIKNNAGVLYLLTGSPEDARLAFVSALADFDRALAINAGDAAARHGRAWALNYQADALHALSRTDEAATVYKEAIAARVELCSMATGVEYEFSHAWLLLTCQDLSLRDSVTGSAIAQKLVTADPNNGRLQILQALAQLRTKNYPGSVISLNTAALVKTSRKSPAGFLRAMALWLNQDQPGAMTAWKAADAAMQQFAPGDLKLRQMRAESAALLKISLEKQAEPPPAETGGTDSSR